MQERIAVDYRSAGGVEQFQRTALAASSERLKVLFVAESVTFAHYIRPLILAESLDPNYFEVHFASSGKVISSRPPNVERFWEIHTNSSADFLARVEQGKLLYSYPELKGYLHDDLALIGAVKPDLVIGDFRWSLSTSARLAGVPYIALHNGYWSPTAQEHLLPLPRKFAAVRYAKGVQSFIQGQVLKGMLAPINKLRVENGLKPAANFFEAVTDSDRTLYLDPVEYFSGLKLADNHQFLGPVTWSPQVALPQWWHTRDRRRPLILTMLGSSGDWSTLPLLIEAVKDSPFDLAVATGGPRSLPAAPNLYVAEFLPGNQCAREAALVICNGGTPSVYQAFQGGTPVLGIVRNNMDQLLSMRMVEQHGAGKLLPRLGLNSRKVGRAISELVNNPRYASAAEHLSQHFDPEAAIHSFGKQLLGYYLHRCPVGREAQVIN